MTLIHRITRAGLVLSLAFAAVGVATAQRYLISTAAGGSTPLGPLPALEVSIGHVFGVATDPSGSVYFSSGRHCVYKLDPRGVLMRVAGTCQAGFSGDGGPATAAQLDFPRGLAVDSDGNLYIADYYNCRIRRVTKSGTITTIAGTTGTGGSICSASSGDSGPATSATLGYPSAVAADLSGNVYIVEYDRVRKVSPGGAITTIASSLSFPSAAAVDSAGNLYIAADSQVLKVASDGRVIAFAGKPNTFGESGDGGPALSASFASIIGLAVDSIGNVIVGDGTIRAISPDGIVHTIAGADCCNVTNVYRAWAGNTGAVAVDPSGNIYVAIVIGDVLRKVTPKGVVTTVAGTTNPSYVGDGGPATDALLSTPEAVAVDAPGNLFIADYGNSRVRKVSPGGTITTFAGNGISGYSGDGGPASSAQVGGPVGLAMDSSGNLFISEYLNNLVRKVSPDGLISTVAGGGPCCDLGDGGPAARAVIPMPHGIALDRAGNLYISEWPDSRIRKVTIDGAIQTIAGTGLRGFSGDGGPATQAELDLPWGLAANDNGTIYIADNQNSRVRKISADGTITTIAGAQNPGIGNAQGVAVDSAGNLFIADGGLWKVSTNGKISGLSLYSNDGKQVSAGGTGLTIDSQGNLFVVSGNRILKLQPIASPVPIDSVANAASSLTGALAPGEIVVIGIAGFGPNNLTTSQSGTAVATNLAGTRVLFNGKPGPVVYTSATKISAIVPYDVTSNVTIGIPGGTPGPPLINVQSEYQGQQSEILVMQQAESAPGLFTSDWSGQGQAAAYNQDGSLNSAANPAQPGSVIALFATGEGQTNPGGVDGELGVAPLPQPTAKVGVTIGGKSAEVRFAGGVSGQVAGLMQVNAVVPSGIPAGSAVPVILSIGNVSSQAGVTIAVAGN